MYELLLAYPAVGIELVGIVAGVEHRDGDDGLVTVVVGPVSDTGGDCEDVALAEAVDPLVLVSDAGLLSPGLMRPLLLLLELLERFWAPWHHRAGDAPALDDVDEAGGVEEGRQEEAPGLDCSALGRNTGALELLVALVEELGAAGLRLDDAGGLLGAQPVDAALGLRPETALGAVLCLG